MSLLQNYDFIVGGIVGGILIGAVIASSLFRTLSLAAAASAVVVLYFNYGIIGLLRFGKVLTADFVYFHPHFGQGVVAGALLVFVAFAASRTRSV
jgi:hypothetical protein